MRAVARIRPRWARGLSGAAVVWAVCGAGIGLAAEDRADPVAGARRLREAAQSGRLAPLPDSGSGITRDVGMVAVIEHDGSDYGRYDGDGGPNYPPRAAVAQTFYQTHGDAYDFLVVFTNFEFDTGEAVAFHNLVRNDVRGIGLAVGDSGVLFGSPGRLKGYVDMAALDRYRRSGYSLTPGDVGFRTTLNVVAHEVAHQWLTSVRFLDGAGQPSTDLLGRDGVHWSALLDSDASVLYGAEWTPNPGGTFTATRILDTYSSLDLYLMGLLDPAKVGPIHLLRNPAVDATALPVEGATVSASVETLGVDRIVGAEGVRQPDHQASPKRFRAGFVFLTAPGVEPSAEDLEAVERVREAFASHFFALTRGVAVADTTLAEGPPQPHPPAPDLERALAWLLSRQDAEGAWADSGFTALRDTSAALEALIAGAVAGAPLDRGLAYVAGASPQNADLEARRAAVLALASPPGLDRAALAASLLARQNEDGGFGLSAGHPSNALDTALSLRALYALGRPLDGAVQRAVSALGALRRGSGGWPSVAEGEMSTVATATAVLALQDWSAAPEAQALVGPGLAALLSRRNPDGGFGESPSSPYATALALTALLRSGGASEAALGAVAWLEGSQLLDGSWQGSAYQTALVLSALKGGTAANLVVPPDSLVVDPASAREGETVRVTARVRNEGRVAAGPSRARLFDGAPRSGATLAEASVGALEPGAESEIVLEFSTADRAGDRTLYVVADADGDVPESREDDNAASRALRVEGLLADLVIGGLEVRPTPPEEGEVAEVVVTVRNVGERAADPSVVAVFDGAVLLGQAPVPALDPGEAAPVALSWDTAGRQGSHVLAARADALYAVYESDELNNEAETRIDVTGPLPPGPDLAFGGLRLAPSVLSTIPQAIQAEVVVRNLGRDPASADVALYDGDTSSTPLAVQSIDLAPRTQVTLALAIEVSRGGTRSLIAVADPGGVLAETDETNNEASAVLGDPANTLDLAILPADVTVTPGDVVVGEPVTVTAVVRNRGTAPVSSVPVVLALPDGGEQARTTVSLAPGAVTTVDLAWTTSVTGDPVPLAVVADPFGLVAELSEDNNRAGVDVRVRPSALPNLAVQGTDVAFTPDPPLEGGTAQVSALVRNPSPTDAGAFAVRFYRGDPAAGGTPIGEAAIAGIPAASSAVATVVWEPVDVRGAQAAFVLVDPEGAVEEYDETDNRAFRPFSAAGLPDLVLAVADVRLTPAFPRAGEAVTVRAAVRNLGSQASGPAVLQVLEGEGDAAVVVAEEPIPVLEPGGAAALEVGWTPSGVGETALTLLADAEDAVREQDEGNNRARRSVVVQDADLYLTAPYFSPDGDGVRDETRLAWRATGSVTIVVSDEDGREVRTLAQEGPAEGSVAWDGRDTLGRVLPDGSYSLTLAGEGGAVLGRIQAVIDTNRAVLHDAAGTGQVAIRNLTCALPDVVGPAWTPAEDEVLLIVARDQGNYRAGLLRVGMDGVSAYLFEDPWYQDTAFASAGAVSPDGREVLVQKGALFAVDLATGARRSLDAASSAIAAWSPDGRWIATNNEVLARDGTFVAAIAAELSDYSGTAWAWSPDGQLLAKGNTIVRRDGTDRRVIELPENTGGTVLETAWRADGTVYTRAAECGDGCFGVRTFLLDPAAGTATEIPWLAAKGSVAWSPHGTRVLYSDAKGAWVAREDGSAPVQLVARGIGAAPRSVAGWYASNEAARPGGACAGQGFQDVFGAVSLLNLTAQLQATRLPANNGMLLRGTVADRHLDHHQLEYASSADPETWHPIGAASEVPVLDDVLAVFVPPAPGTYSVRLRAVDRAGNARSRTRVIAWDRVPALANLTQDEFLVSPNSDAVKDAVTFRYLVVEPTQVEVRIVGTQGPASGATVRRFSFAQPETGPGSFVWDGRDEAGARVPDGRYTAFVNDIPLRVDVDATPPDVAWSYADLRAVARTEEPGGLEVPVLVVDRLRHVTDANLKSWSGPGPTSDTVPVYEPERDAEGNVVYEDGRPKVKLVGGRPADEREPCEFVLPRAGQPRPECVATRTVMTRSGDLAAEDHAGNRAVLPVFPVEEKIFVFYVDGARVAPLEPGRVHRWAPTPSVDLRATFTAGEIDLRLEYRPAGGGAWNATPVARTGVDFRSALRWSADLFALGLSATVEYQGRFAAPGRAGEVYSEEFRFRLCREAGELLEQTGHPDFLPYVRKPVFAGAVAPHAVEARLDIPEPIREVRLEVREIGPTPPPLVASAPMARRESDGVWAGTAWAPNVTCSTTPRRFLGFSVVVTGESGRVYPTSGPCVSLRTVVPTCGAGLEISQAFPYCGGSPDQIQLEVAGSFSASVPGVVELTRGPESPAVPIAALEVGRRFETLVSAGVADLADGEITLHGRLTVPVEPEPLVVTRDGSALVDRTPPSADVLLPPEGVEVCPTPNLDTGREEVELTFRVDDAGPQAEFLGLEWSRPDRPWTPALLRCDADDEGARCGNLADEHGESEFPRLVTGAPAPLVWDVTDLPSGDYSLRLTSCDRAGSRTPAERRFHLRKETPDVQAFGASPSPFSPNGDGRLDATTVTGRTFQALQLHAEVRQGDPDGPVVRTLLDGEPRAAGPFQVSWDGRNDQGQVVPDGGYAVVLTGVSGCGQGRASVGVVVDTAPPVAAIAVPAADAALGPVVDVRGEASDPNFGEWVLDYGAGEDPAEWNPIVLFETRTVPGPAGFFRSWSTPQSDGRYVLRLRTKDRAENEAEVRVPVTVLPRTFVDRFTVTPSLFSPNGDGRRETAAITYRLTAPGTVTLEIRARGPGGGVLKTFEAAAPRDGETLYERSWDGTDDAGAPLPPERDGEHVVRILVEDGAGGSQEATAALVLDRVPPAVTVDQPEPDGFTARNQDAVGSTVDPNFGTYEVSATQGVETLELSRGSRPVVGASLASLGLLADGPHVLSVLAEDAAENRTRVDVPFIIDTIPPVVALHEPAPGAVLDKGATPVAVRGTATDDYLDEYVLSFGPGTEPSYFVEIARGGTGGTAVPLGSWTVAAIPDGVYTLLLTARDQAGNDSLEARRTVVLDGTAPAAAIASPAENAYVNSSRPVTGTASDANLAAWKLEWAPGTPAEAVAFAELASGTDPVEGGVLGALEPLPPDGPHTLRLTVEDGADHVSTAVVGFTVDTIPPAPPAGLTAETVRSDGPTAEVRLAWTAGTEPDLAGYRVSRDGTLLTPDLLAEPAFADPGRPEGRYLYSVVAVDRAGNASDPATVTARVDVTPPVVDLLYPEADAAVSGSVDVRGTAFSADDFGEYRLLVGAGSAPSSWTLLARRTLPVSAGVVGSWTAVGDGLYVLALEAEDTSGNQARVETPVRVDNEPPDAPVLTAAETGPDPDAVTATWEPSVAGDVAGYLVYRNGRVANAPGLVLDGLEGFLVPGPSHADAALPDGEHCYRVAAMDEAGNLSPPSNELCRSLDNRAPQAVILQPADGARFEFPVRVVAFTPDTDLASVLFQHKPAADTEWSDLGAPDVTPPFETSLDPEILGGYGAYDLRAVATDTGGRTDPAPASVRVVYGDATPPAPPRDLGLGVDGQRVELTWAAGAEPDLAGYRVSRDGEELGTTETPGFVDALAPLGAHVYEAASFDADGNESAPSGVEALVYAVDVEPRFPVVQGAADSVAGHGAQPGTTVEILRDGAVVASAPAAGDAFRVDAVPLVLGPNRLQARGVDAEGNRSVVSDPLLLISNTPPGVVADLQAAVADRDVTLAWTPVGDADARGYLVRRRGALLTGIAVQDEASAVTASASTFGHLAAAAFDGDPATAWVPPPASLPATWTVELGEERLVAQVDLLFGGLSGDPGDPVADYRVEASGEGEFIPLAVVRGNTQQSVSHPWPQPFATDAVRVVVESGEFDGLAEVTLHVLEAVQEPSFTDADVPDGEHTYAVTIVDRYGAEGAPVEVVAAVGDVEPPPAPEGLTATVAGRDVALAWDASAGPDVDHYVVLRDGVRIAEAAGAFHRDLLLPDGEYRYTVVAVDAVGNESPESEPALAVVAVAPVPPPAPVIVEPAAGATVEDPLVDVRGFAAPGSLVALDVNGELVGIVEAEAGAPSFAETGAAAIVDGAFRAVASPDGATLAYGSEDEAGAVRATVLDVATGAEQELAQEGYEEVTPAGFSSDGRLLAYEAASFGEEPPRDGVFVVDLATGVRTAVSEGPESEWGPAVSPEGGRVAFLSASEEAVSLKLHDLGTGETRTLAGFGLDVEPSSLAWSPDGSRLAYLVGPSEEEGPAELRVVDVASGADTTVAEDAWPGTAVAWSPEGTRLAYTADGGGVSKVVLADLVLGAREDVSDGNWAQEPRFDPTGGRLLYAEPFPHDSGALHFAFLVRDLRTGEDVPLGPTIDVEHPHALLLLEWLRDGRILASLDDRAAFFRDTSGGFEVPGVSLRPGENVLVASAFDPDTGLESPPSAPARVTLAAGDRPNLAVSATDLGTYPALPVAGQPAMLSARVRNLGTGAAEGVEVEASVLDEAGTTVFETTRAAGTIRADGSALVSFPWTPAAPGSYLLRVVADPDGTVAEQREDDNHADRGLLAVAGGDLFAEVEADRLSYPAATPARATVALLNAGADFEGRVRTLVATLAGEAVALVDERAAALAYGQALEYTAVWNTGTTYAGGYAFRVEAVDASGAVRAQASAGFRILPDVAVTARLTPVRASIARGEAARFTARVENRGVNAPLDDLVARLGVAPAGGGPEAFSSQAPVPPLLPGGVWEGTLEWPEAAPEGSYAATLAVTRADGTSVATGGATFEVTPPPVLVIGTLALDPADVLAGGATQAQVSVTNPGPAPLRGSVVAVDVTAAADATVLVRATAAVDLAPGETRDLTLALATEAVAPGAYPVFLRVEGQPASLDRATLRVHGAITAPSVDSPPDGATIATPRPALCVNNASSSGGAALAYEYEVFADAALQQRLVSRPGVPEGAGRTCWTVTVTLAEDRPAYWRARASDGFSSGPYTAVAAFTVDAANEAPSAPSPDTPLPGARVASREPVLTVTNAVDPEFDVLVYDFQLASDAEMTAVVASAAGLAEGSAFTAWTVPVTLDENATYYWRARASDRQAASPWSAPVSFVVDSVDETPSAPVPLRPVGGVEVATLAPELAVGNAADPEGAPLTYLFEIDRAPTFDSPALQVSGPIPEEPGETAWTPANPLADEADHYWRAAASDGNTLSAWAQATFFVNLGNDPPSAPVPLDPADGQVATTATPTLRARNAVDTDRDVLTYEFRVTDEADTVVASVAGVAEMPVETAWTVPVELTENAFYRWSCRASDGEAAGPWSTPAGFRVNAVDEPPTAPTPVSPGEGEVLGARQVTFTVANASSPDGLALTYAFELYAEAADGTLTPVDGTEGIAEGTDTTSWTAPGDLADGAYAWRARAFDGARTGPWTATVHFAVAVNVPPAPPAGLVATPGDGRVDLSWTASPEPDVVEYRVYRALVPGGPYDLAGVTAAPAFADTGLANGVTVYYVVTAFDGVFESERSGEAAATPEAAGDLAAEVRFRPSEIAGECLVAAGSRQHRHGAARGPRPAHGGGGDDCPHWLYATIELPAGVDPGTIDVGTVRLAGSVAADRHYSKTTDGDHDGIPERKVRFRFSAAAALLTPGVNELSVSGTAGGDAFQGVGTVTVSELDVDLWVTPRTLNRRSHGQDVLAKLTFRCGVEADAVEIESVRLNETVPVERVVSRHGRTLKVKFDRAEVNAVLPVGDRVEVRVSGTVGGVPFVARDCIRVIE